MEIKANLCGNAIRKVALLITKASDLEMDVTGYGFADENQNSGNVYLWLEDYPFTLYIGLSDDAIWASWSDPEAEEESEIEVDGMNLAALEDWAAGLDAKARGEDDEE